jgi:hypothetical protein
MERQKWQAMSKYYIGMKCLAILVKKINTVFQLLIAIIELFGFGF